MNTIKEWSKEFILLLLGAGLGFVGNYWLASESNEIPYFDKYFSTDKSVISKKNLLSHDVKLFVDKIEVEKISKLNVSLLNYSNNFYKDINVLIKLKPKDGDIKVLSAHAVGENDEKDIVVDLKEEDKNAFRYNIKTAKRTDAYDEFFKVIFYYEGDLELSSEEIVITVLNADPKIRDFNSEHSPENIKTKLKATWYLILSVSGLIVFVFFVFSMVSRFTRGLDRKANKKYARSLVEASECVPSLSGVEDIKNTLIELLYEQRMLRWKTLGRLTRWADGNIPPKKSDYDYDE